MIRLFTHKTLQYALIAYGAAMGLLGCNPLTHWGIALSNTPINAIAEIGQTTAKKTIQIQGKVINIAPLVNRGAYQLSDQTGTIWILTNEALPNPGEDVIVRGQLQYQSIPVGRQDLGEFYLVEMNQSPANIETASPTNSQIEPGAPVFTPPAPPLPARTPPPKEEPILPNEDLFLPHK